MEKITNEDYTNVLGSFMETSLECIDNIDKELKLEKDKNNKAIEYIERDLANINIQENIVAKNELLQIKRILKGEDK